MYVGVYAVKLAPLNVTFMALTSSGVMVKALDCGIVAREFELQSRYNVHFRTNTLEKSMNPLIHQAIG